jgi:hypothetical protein
MAHPPSPEGFHFRQPVGDGPASADKMVDRKNEEKGNF